MFSRCSLASSFGLTVGILVHALILTAFVLAPNLSIAQTGLPFSGVPAGGLGNPPGITFPTPGTVPVSIAGHGAPHVGRRVFAPGAVPIFFGDDLYGTKEPGTVVINNIVPSPEAPNASIVQEPPAPPLIIELQGDKWVRRRLVATEPGKETPQTESEPQPRPARETQPLPETILVFRDGHRENVATYMIFDGALYHSTPAWAPQQQVKLLQLDLPATENVNRRRGVVFRLPNSPNEVVTRP